MLLTLQAAGGIPFFIFLFGSILSVALARIFGTVWLQGLIFDLSREALVCSKNAKLHEHASAIKYELT